MALTCSEYQPFEQSEGLEKDFQHLLSHFIELGRRTHQVIIAHDARLVV